MSCDFLPFILHFSLYTSMVEIFQSPLTILTKAKEKKVFLALGLYGMVKG